MCILFKSANVAAWEVGRGLRRLTCAELCVLLSHGLLKKKSPGEVERNSLHDLSQLNCEGASFEERTAFYFAL